MVLFQQSLTTFSNPSINRVSPSFYNELIRTGTDRKTGFTNEARWTMKFLTGHPLIGENVNTLDLTFMMASVGPLASANAVPTGVWNDSGTLQAEINPAITARGTDGRFTADNTVYEEITFTFSASYVIAANDHIGMQFNVSGNADNYMKIDSDTNAPPSNTECYGWSDLTTKGSAVTSALAMRISLT